MTDPRTICRLLIEQEWLTPSSASRYLGSYESAVAELDEESFLGLLAREGAIDDDQYALLKEALSSATPQLSRLATRAQPAETPAPLPLDLLGGSFEKYELVRELGRGGMGTVYLANDRDLQRRTALKLCQRPEPEIVARFLREARIGSRLDHPNIAPIYDAGPAPKGNVYFAMKYIEGTPLSDVIRALRRSDEEMARRYPLPRRLALFTKVLDGVAYAHAQGVIHRDIKPANVMIGRFGEVLVVDWGLAKAVDDAESEVGESTSAVAVLPRRALEAGQTIDGAIVGTPGYLAPEQARGDLDAHSPRSDVYSLGVMLYELLTFRRAFTGQEPFKLLDAAEAGHFVAPRRAAPERNIPPALEAVVLKAMATLPAGRYAEASEIRADIDAYLAERPMSVYTPPLRERVLGVVRRHTGALVLSVGVALALATLAAIAWQLDAAKVAEQQKTIAAEARMRAAEVQKTRAAKKALTAERVAVRLAREASARAERRQRALAPYMQARQRMAWRFDFAKVRAVVVPLLERTLEIDPAFIEAGIELIKVLLYLGRIPPLLTQTKELLEHLPDDDRARLTPLMTQVVFGIATRSVPKISGDLDRFRPRFLPRSTWRLLIAQYLTTVRAHDQALRVIDELMADPATNGWEVAYLKARIFKDLGRREEAHALLSEQLALLPQLAILHCARGSMARELKQNRAAREDLTRAAVLDDAYHTTWIELGYLALQERSGRSQLAHARYFARALASVRHRARGIAIEPTGARSILRGGMNVLLGHLEYRSKEAPATVVGRRRIEQMIKRAGSGYPPALTDEQRRTSAPRKEYDDAIADARREVALFAAMTIRATTDPALRRALAVAGVTAEMLDEAATYSRERAQTLRPWLVPASDPLWRELERPRLADARRLLGG